jgi:uncharacterized protein with FMN-binding domain
MKGGIRVKSKSELKTKKEVKRKMTGWIIALIIVAVLGVGGAIGWSFLSKEHNEAKNLSLNGVDFSKLNDGTYIGEYEGGMYKWRANKVQVMVTSGKVKDIKLLSSSDPGAKNTGQASLYERVIEAQSLQVDTISGATLTSKAYLKAVEIALEQAQKK